jgi:hypothetical protein
LATALAVSGSLLWFASAERREPERGCADVGFDTQTSGVTPDDAMSAYVRSQGGDPADWASGGDLLEHAYHPRTADAEPAGYSEIGMLEITAGVWRAAGGCVK